MLTDYLKLNVTETIFNHFFMGLCYAVSSIHWFHNSDWNFCTWLWQHNNFTFNFKTWFERQLLEPKLQREIQSYHVHTWHSTNTLTMYFYLNKNKKKKQIKWIPHTQLGLGHLFTCICLLVFVYLMTYMHSIRPNLLQNPQHYNKKHNLNILT